MQIEANQGRKVVSPVLNPNRRGLPASTQTSLEIFVCSPDASQHRSPANPASYAG